MLTRHGGLGGIGETLSCSPGVLNRRVAAGWRVKPVLGGITRGDHRRHVDIEIVVAA